MLRNPINTGVSRIREARAISNRRFDGHSENDADPVGSRVGGSRRSHEQAVARDLDHLSSLAVSEVKKNGVFVLPGIGRLVRVDRKARMGRNPATGESIKIPAKKVVKFRVAKAAKDAIVPPKVRKLNF